MRKTLLLAFGLALALTACGGGDAGTPTAFNAADPVNAELNKTPTSGKPTTISATAAISTVVEGGSFAVHLAKFGGNGRPVAVSWSTSNGQGGTVAVGSAGADVAVKTTDDSIVNGTRTLGFAAIASTGAKAALTLTILDNDVAAPPPPPVQYQMCPDGSMIPVGQTCPPVVAPPPSSGDLFSTGLPDIQSEFDPHLGLANFGGIPGSADGDVGAFRFNCAVGQLLRDDPIVYPGQPGKSHLHQFFGNTGADAYSTFASLRTGGHTTCGDSRSPYALNRSGYWVPAMLDGKGHVINPDQVGIYYKRWPATDFHCGPGWPTTFNVQGQDCVPLPNGLRFIMGYNMLHPEQSPTGAVEFKCNADLHNYETLTQALARCKVFGGKQLLLAVINAPDCWDGKRLDSADHRSHVAYSSYGGDASGMGGWGYPRCDAEHPHVIPKFTMTVNYTIDFNVDDPSLIHYSSDEAMGTAPGVTFHGDWFGAWDPVIMGMWMDNCINKQLNCSAGALGNGFGLQYAGGGIYFDAAGNEIFPINVNPNRLVPIPPLP